MAITVISNLKKCTGNCFSFAANDTHEEPVLDYLAEKFHEIENWLNKFLERNNYTKSQEQAVKICLAVLKIIDMAHTEMHTIQDCSTKMYNLGNNLVQILLNPKEWTLKQIHKLKHFFTETIEMTRTARQAKVNGMDIDEVKLLFQLVQDTLELIKLLEQLIKEMTKEQQAIAVSISNLQLQFDHVSKNNETTTVPNLPEKTLDVINYNNRSSTQDNIKHSNKDERIGNSILKIEQLLKQITDLPKLMNVTNNVLSDLQKILKYPAIMKAIGEVAIETPRKNNTDIKFNLNDLEDPLIIDLLDDESSQSNISINQDWMKKPTNYSHNTLLNISSEYPSWDLIILDSLLEAFLDTKPGENACTQSDIQNNACRLEQFMKSSVKKYCANNESELEVPLDEIKSHAINIYNVFNFNIYPTKNEINKATRYNSKNMFKKCRKNRRKLVRL